MGEEHTQARSLTSRVIDWFCVNVPNDDLLDAKLRSRFTVFLFIGIALALVPVGLLSLALGQVWSAIASTAAVGICFVVGIVLRVTGSTQKVGVIAVCLSIVLAIAWGVAMGQHYIIALIPSFSIVLAAAYFVGKRAMLATTLAHILLLAVFVVADVMGQFTLVEGADSSIRIQFALATGLFMLVTAAFGYVLVQSHETLQARATADRDRAEQAAQSQRDFIATISHEFRTPLNGILGMNSLLLETHLDNEQRDFGTNTQRAAEMMLGLVNDILEFSRLESGGMTIDVAPFCLQDVVYDVAELLRTPAHEKNLDLIVAYDPRIPTLLHGDGDRVRQVLLNLMANAVKFTEHGHLMLSVDAEVMERAAKVTLCVADSGVGIPADKLDVIFNRFARANQTRTTQGSGLGLTITHALVDAMGGEITVTSTVGLGSTFTVELTLPTVADLTSEHALSKPLTNKHVVLLDPHGRSALSVETLLAWAGGTTTHVTTPQTALTALHEGEVDGRHIHCALVVLDEPSAEEFIITLREHQPRGIPVVLVAPTLRTEARDRLRALGFDRIMVSPPRPKALLAAVRQPRKVGTTLSIRTTRAKPSIAAPEPAELGRVLLVEDNIINRRVASTMLTREGLRVDHAVNGLEAIDMVRTITYDAVFMDCAMPVMDGYEATREIRAISGPASKVPIIALTASILPRDRSEALNAGMDDHIPKPLTLEMLRAILATWVPGCQGQLKVAGSE